MKPIIARCYAVKKGEVYFAACITFNLTATGSSFPEAKENLNALISDYLDEISKDRSIEEFEHLLNRPAPIFMYVEHALCFVISHLIKQTEKQSPKKAEKQRACYFEERIPYNVQFAH